jgi:hypothetical protein
MKRESAVRERGSKRVGRGGKGGEEEWKDEEEEQESAQRRCKNMGASGRPIRRESFVREGGEWGCEKGGCDYEHEKGGE